jgi:hypothetical protein
MLQLALRRFFKKEKADKAWYYVGMVFLALVLVNIGAAFIR